MYRNLNSVKQAQANTCGGQKEPSVSHRVHRASTTDTAGIVLYMEHSI